MDNQVVFYDRGAHHNFWQYEKGRVTVASLAELKETLANNKRYYTALQRADSTYTDINYSAFHADPDAYLAQLQVKFV